MEAVIKGLEGKTLSKKKIFDILLGLNLETLGSNENNKDKEDKEDGKKFIEDKNKDKEDDTDEDDTIEDRNKDKEDDTDEDDTIEDRNNDIEEENVEEFNCKACMKNFATKSSLTRHYKRFNVCKEWIKSSQNSNIPILTKGIHHLVNDLLEMSIGENGQFQCKFCNTTFITRGNHHKHYNTSTVCNRLAFLEFKHIINSL